MNREKIINLPSGNSCFTISGDSGTEIFKIMCESSEKYDIAKLAKL